MLVAFASSTATTQNCNFTDNLNGAWSTTPVVSSNTTLFSVLFSKPNSLAGACTVSYNFGVGSTATFAIFEVAGLGAPLLDKTATAHNASYAGAYVGPTAATTQANEVVIAGFTSGSAANTSLWTNTSTPPGTVLLPGNSPYGFACIYWVYSAMGTAAGTFGVGTSASASFESVIATWGTAGPQAPTVTKGIVTIRSTSQTG